MREVHNHIDPTNAARIQNRIEQECVVTLRPTQTIRPGIADQQIIAGAAETEIVLCSAIQDIITTIAALPVSLSAPP